MYNIRIDNEQISAAPGTSLLAALRENAITLEAPCGGKGTCGKCKVRVVSSGREVAEDPLTQEELDFFSEREVAEGYRLACVYKPQGDIEIALCDTGFKSKHNAILVDGNRPDIEIHSEFSVFELPLAMPTIENQISLEEAFWNSVETHFDNAANPPRATVDFDRCTLDLNLLKKLPPLFLEGRCRVVLRKQAVINLLPSSASEELYGVAIDIGTTTVAASLINLADGKLVGTSSAINPQKDYGLDVLSRIEYEMSHDAGLETLNKSILGCLNALIKDLLRDARLDVSSIYDIVIAANSAMTHLLLGLSAVTIGKSPYVPVIDAPLVLRASDIGLDTLSHTGVFVMPAVSSFIGGDIVSGVLAAGIKDASDRVLFIDIGTNGELVLSLKGVMSSCSCAAGPALEGMNISCGMRASDGAIERISIASPVQLGVIGDSKPLGICGSGIIDGMSELVRCQLVGKTGRLKKPDALGDDYAGLIVDDGKTRKFILSSDDGMILTQNDIRQIQLAKGAISSGIHGLVASAGTSFDELDRVVIAGQFGKHLSVESLVGVGIIPQALSEKVTYIGNASNSGAVMCLLNNGYREEVRSIAKAISYFELSNYENYDRLFAKCLNFY